MINLGNNVYNESVVLDNYLLAQHTMILGDYSNHKNKFLMNLMDQFKSKHIPFMLFDGESIFNEWGRDEGVNFVSFDPGFMMEKEECKLLFNRILVLPEDKNFILPDISIFNPTTDDSFHYFNKVSLIFKVVFSLSDCFIGVNASIMDKLYKERNLSLQTYLASIKEEGKRLGDKSRVDFAIVEKVLLTWEENKKKMEGLYTSVTMDELMQMPVIIRPYDIKNPLLRKFYLLLLLYNVTIYYEKHRSAKWDIKNMLLFYHGCEIFTPEYFSYVIEHFIQETRTHSMGIIIEDERLDSYSDGLLYYFSNLVLFPYSGNMTRLYEKRCFNKIPLHSFEKMSDTYAYVKTKRSEEYLIQMDNVFFEE